MTLINRKGDRQSQGTKEECDNAERKIKQQKTWSKGKEHLASNKAGRDSNPS